MAIRRISSHTAEMPAPRIRPSRCSGVSMPERGPKAASAIASAWRKPGRPKGAKGKKPKWSELHLSRLGATLKTLAHLYPGASDVTLAKILKEKSLGTPLPTAETLRKRFKQARSVYEAQFAMPPGAEAACRAWIEEMSRPGPQGETSRERGARAARVYKDVMNSCQK